MEFLIILLVVLGVIAAIAIPWYVIRQRYIKAFEALGWTFVNSPVIDIVHGLNVPPFGLGFDRKVDEQVIGTTSNGTPFQAFEYSSTAYHQGGFVVTMPLRHSMPEFHLVPNGRQRDGSRTVVASQTPTHLALGVDVAYGQRVLSAIGHLTAGFPQLHPADLTIDHDQIVALVAPTDAAGLKPFVETLAPLVGALNDPQFDEFTGPERPAEMGWYGRPDWVYRTRDDAMLQTVNHSQGGGNHRARNVIFCNTEPLPFVRLTHDWETTRTETDSEGRTRTVTDHHSEEIFEYHPTFPFNDFKINAGWFGDKRTFESEDFNRQFTIRASDPRFAHDIFHPRMMEYLMHTRPGPVVHDGAGRLSIEFSGSTTTIESATEFLKGFFSRVPNYVWENLGLATPPIPLHSSITDGRTPQPPAGSGQQQPSPPQAQPVMHEGRWI